MTLTDDQTNAVSICDTNHAINSNGPPGAPAQEGSFSLCRDEPDGFLPETTVNYVMSGEASNSVDYALLNGTVTFAEGQRYLTVPIDPISSWTNTAKTVVMTLVPGNYFIDSNSVYLPGGAAITNYIQNSSSEISVIWTKDAVEPQGTNLAQTGVFTVSRHDGRDRYDQLSVNYTLSGSAINGVDYTNLSGVVTFAPGARQTNIYVGPILDTNYPGDKMAKLSLTPATYYYIDTGFPSVGTNYSSAIVVILDNNIVFQATTNFNGLIIGLVYNPYVTNLIVSEETGRPDFKAIGTNITQIGGNIVTNVVITNWSNIGTLGDEVYMALATNSSSGFTNGDMFFGANTGVGWLSSNAAVSNLSWSALTNAAITNSSLLRGGICFDSTGAFSNNLIAVGVSGEVWEVDSQAHPTFLAQITNTALVEGVCVVPANFGPWSKQIITGDEVLNLLYLIDTNKIVTQVDPEILFPGGVNSESISIIPSNQSLYLAGSRGEIIKLPASYFKNYSGDLMIHDGAERGSINKLLIVHWDAASSNFVSWRVRCTLSCPEGAAFAPIELPVN